MGREPPIDEIDLLLVEGCTPADRGTTGQLLMQAVAKGHQLIQKWIRPSPVPDRDFDIWAVLEIAEEPDHSWNIGGMISASQQAVPGGIQIGGRLLQRTSCDPVAERNGDRLLEPDEQLFVSGLGIDREKVDGVFLALRPHALATDKGANRREQLQTKAGQKPLKNHNRHEGRYKPQKAIFAARGTHHLRCLICPSARR